jgi:hypothetical protein
VKGNSFIVIDVDGIHPVSMDFCGCFCSPPQYIQLLRSRLYPATIHFPATAMTFRVLDHVQMVCYQSKLSIHDYFTAISRQMDNTGLACLPVSFISTTAENYLIHSLKDRKEELRRILCQWGHLHLLKRAGRGHDPAGVAATGWGECAVLCPACPQPGKNLPENWKDVPEKDAYAYLSVNVYLLTSVLGGFMHCIWAWMLTSSPSARMFPQRIRILLSLTDMPTLSPRENTRNIWKPTKIIASP